MKKENFRVTYPSSEGKVEWSCPSNIAIVKYWGKRPGQIPMNPSLSLTLKNALTTTRIAYLYDPSITRNRIIFRFEGKAASSFSGTHRKISGGHSIPYAIPGKHQPGD